MAFRGVRPIKRVPRYPLLAKFFDYNFMCVWYN